MALEQHDLFSQVLGAGAGGVGGAGGAGAGTGGEQRDASQPHFASRMFENKPTCSA